MIYPYFWFFPWWFFWKTELRVYAEEKIKELVKNKRYLPYSRYRCESDNVQGHSWNRWLFEITPTVPLKLTNLSQNWAKTEVWITGLLDWFHKLLVLKIGAILWDYACSRVHCMETIQTKEIKISGIISGVILTKFEHDRFRIG